MSTRALTKTVAAVAANPVHVALYCRISKDKTGRVEGVRNQEKWGHAYAAHQWPDLPVVIYSDNDLSAADEDVHRPGFDALKEALKAGLVAAVWAVEQSRLERTEIGWFTLAAMLDAAGITEVHTRRDGIVRVRDDVAGIKAVINAGEVRKLKKRVNDRLDANAAAGIPNGARPYGYRHGLNEQRIKTFTIIEAEAAIIRECADRVLAGWSMMSIAKDLRARGVTGHYRVKVRDDAGNVVTEDGTPEEDGGVPVTQLGRIGHASVKSWLLTPAVTGLRVHRGEIVGEGNWEPILDRATWNAVRARLTGPRTVLRGDGGGEKQVDGVGHHRYSRASRRYLLTGGIAVCGVCGAPLIAQEMTFYRDGQPRKKTAQYRCPPPVRGGHGCLAIYAEQFEEHVAATLMAELDSPAFRQALAVDEHAARRDGLLNTIDAIDGEIAELARMLGAREMSTAEWRIAKAAAVARQQQARAELSTLPPPAVIVDATAIREGWAAMNLDERRQIVTMFIDRVAVNRARPGVQVFDTGRIASPDTWWRSRR